MRAWRRIRVFGAVVGVVGLSGLIGAGCSMMQSEQAAKGKKLYAVRDAGGKFKDIQSYARAHAADIRKSAKAEATTKKKASKKKTVKRKAAKKKASKA